MGLVGPEKIPSVQSPGSESRYQLKIDAGLCTLGSGSWSQKLVNMTLVRNKWLLHFMSRNPETIENKGKAFFFYQLDNQGDVVHGL